MPRKLHKTELKCNIYRINAVILKTYVVAWNAVDGKLQSHHTGTVIMARQQKTLVERLAAGEQRIMNHRAFEFAIKGLRLRPKTKEAARLIYVEGMSRPEAIRKSGIDSGTLSKALPRIANNLNKLLAANKLVHKDWIVPAEVAKSNDVIEVVCLDATDSSRKRQK